MTPPRFTPSSARTWGRKTANSPPRRFGEIVQTYTSFQNEGNSKIFDNADFGYWKITVERPLRLTTHATDERISAYQEANPKQASLGDAAREVLGTQPHSDWNRVEKTLKESFSRRGLKATAAQLKKLRDALSESDEEAAPVIKKAHKDGAVEYEPDTALRDTENVPLTDDIHRYFEREVSPHVPDAWIDESKTVKGYEISFTKYFYQYQPLRSLDEIKADIMRLERETDGVLKEIVEV